MTRHVEPTRRQQQHRRELMNLQPEQHHRQRRPLHPHGSVVTMVFSRTRPVWAFSRVLRVLLIGVTVCSSSVGAQPMPSSPVAATPTSTIPTPTDCYATLGALNSVMETELTRIRNGATPNTEYMYTLCSNTIFDATNIALEPVLNNLFVVCGPNGLQTDRCVILGGTTQLRLLDSAVDGYPLQEVSFMGLTFSGFTTNAQGGIGTSIAALASSVTTATFTDCLWQDFSSDFVVQQNATERFLGSMTVQIERSTVRTGVAGVIFDNDGGLLRVSDLSVTGVVANSLVATANNGASFLERSTVTASDLNSVTYTTVGGSQTVMDTSVTQMTRLQDAFFVEDLGSTILLEDVTVQDNQAQTEPWHVVSVRTEAIARISESTIADNTGLEYGIVAFGATVSVADSFLSRNSGLASFDTTSAAIFAITDATVNVERVEFTDNSGFSGLAIALIRSSINIRQSCFQGGSTEYVVFIANDAMYEVSENYIDNLDSEQCLSTGPRLFQENIGSACFLGSSTCEGTCELLADAISCRAQDGPTRAPVLPPTFAPAKAPILMEPEPPVVPTRRPLPFTRSPRATRAPTPTRRTRVPTRTRFPKGMQRPTLVPVRPTVSPAPTVTTLPTTANVNPKPDKTPPAGDKLGKGGKKSSKQSKSDKGLKKKSSKGGKGKDNGGKGGDGKGEGKGGKGGQSDKRGSRKGGGGGKGKSGGHHSLYQTVSPSPVPQPPPDHQVYHRPTPSYESNHPDSTIDEPPLYAEPRSLAPTLSITFGGAISPLVGGNATNQSSLVSSNSTLGSSNLTLESNNNSSVVAVPTAPTVNSNSPPVNQTTLPFVNATSNATILSNSSSSSIDNES